MELLTKLKKSWVYNVLTVGWILRLEGLAIFLASIYFYRHFEGSWVTFVIFILSPDISLLGYLKDQKIGSVAYNIAHNLFLALGIFMIGILFDIRILSLLGLILTAHIGADRFMGYGLKYQGNFKETHIQKV